jgi:hypothetical protein
MPPDETERRDFVPPPVRIALRNAVGGWGPYTVAEIVDLFNSHGFTERAQKRSNCATLCLLAPRFASLTLSRDRSG